MIFLCILLFFPPIILREKMTSNIHHVLSRVYNLIDRCQRKKRNKQNDQIKSVFCVIREPNIVILDNRQI